MDNKQEEDKSIHLKKLIIFLVDISGSKKRGTGQPKNVNFRMFYKI